MTRLLVLIFLHAIIGCLADPQCNDATEYLDTCPVECTADYCPTNEEEAQKTCPSAPTTCPPPACKCRVNYRRASVHNRTCIPTRDCPPFECKGKNQAFNPCPPLCPTDSCTEATPDGSCPRQLGNILILLICSPKCRCIEGYWKQDGVCVPYSECPQNKAPAPKKSGPKRQAPSLPSSSSPDDNPQDDGTHNVYTLPEAADGGGSTDDSASATATAPAGTATATAGSSSSPGECGSESHKAQKKAPAPKKSGPKRQAPSLPSSSSPDDTSQDDGTYIVYTLPQASADGGSATDDSASATATATAGTATATAGSSSSPGKCGSKRHEVQVCTGPNEVYTTEKQSCPGEECFVITARINCTDAPPPAPGCACESGYFRLDKNSPCVHICQCPQMANTLQCQNACY